MREILCLGRIGCREEAETIPDQVEAVAVGDVDGVQVPGFVDEEVNRINGLEDCDEDQGWGYGVVGLVFYVRIYPAGVG